MSLREIERELQSVLGSLKDPRIQGTEPKDLVPSINPGLAVLKRPCTCNLRTGPSFIISPHSGHIFAVSPKHHHQIKIGRRLWRDWSDELGCPQDRFRIH